MVKRLTRTERRSQTRTELVATARRVFLEAGFHSASLEEIAEEAGYTKGAVYSNFDGKDGLFLAVIDDQIERRLRADTDAILAESSLEAALRAAARNIYQAAQQDPRWSPVLVEFWTHASRNDALRAAVSERHERVLDALSEVLTRLVRRHGAEFVIPAREVARGGAAFGRGMALERILAAGDGSPQLFEEMFLSYLLGLIRGRAGSKETEERESRSQSPRRG